MKIVRLEGDLDLFGDGSFRLFRAPGTHARQPVRGGAAEEHRSGDPDQRRRLFEGKPRQEPDPADPRHLEPQGMYEGYQKIRLIRDTEGAQIFMAHDPEAFKATKHAPEFYD
jgi:hypothetical protein